MGPRIAELDWHQTSLGSLEGWPRSLHSIVKTILGSRYPMILLWGPDLIQLYNDAYIGLIGGKHPDALGRSIRDTQAESWDAIGPMIREVMSSGIPNWVPAQQLPLMRSGYLEESYFSLSYSAVDDDEGVIRGMLCVCSEVTEQVVGARRMRLLRGLAAASEARSPKGACEHVGRILEEHALDVPFAALYLTLEPGALELCGASIHDAGHVLPRRVNVHDGSDPLWSFARGMAGDTVLTEDVHRHLDRPAGPFSDTVKAAFLMPIPSANAGAPLGLLIAGVSPARGLDEGYRTFYELLAGQVSMLVRNAHAFQEERKQVEKLAVMNDRLRGEVEERKKAETQLASLQSELVRTARAAGMSEVASGVLHNVGNVLSSINVASISLRERLAESRADRALQASTMLVDHQSDVAAFLAQDPRGVHLPAFLLALATHQVDLNRELAREADALCSFIGHVCTIVGTYQAYGHSSAVLERITVMEIVDAALNIMRPSLERHGVQVECHNDDNPMISTDRHKVLQIVINLLTNARDAVKGLDHAQRIDVRVESTGRGARISVRDNGVGIARENLVRIFAHGFTTKPGAHGFGLHTSANSAREMAGYLRADSAGEGLGAMFVLELTDGSP